MLAASATGRARYGLRLGDWRWGAGLLVAGLAVMTPIILGLSGLRVVPRLLRRRGGAARAPRSLNNLAELIPAEFLLRGFLMFALWRRIGPLALVVVQVPFVLTHIGKPDVELWSTFVGGIDLRLARLANGLDPVERPRARVRADAHARGGGRRDALAVIPGDVVATPRGTAHLATYQQVGPRRAAGEIRPHG